jgi:hypothetical protein
MLEECPQAIRSDPERMSGIEMQRGMHCLGYVSGFVSGYLLGRNGDLCLPEDVTTGQLVRVFLKYLNDHPADLHLRASVLLRRALAGSYPCALP